MARRLAMVLGVAVFCGLVVAGAASAASVALCVPTGAGAAVITPGSGGTCGSATKVSLPSSATDQQTLLSILPHMRYVASGVGSKPTVQLIGVNVQVVNGSGTTTTVNGTGNLMIGYDESPGKQTGSHNLILGTSQTYSSYGGLLAGNTDTISAPYASVTGGANNHATGSDSSVTGGYDNTAKAAYSTVSGGGYNTAADRFTSITAGGCSIAGPGTALTNTNCSSPAGDAFAAITGGVSNTATGAEATVTGGLSNVATGSQASVTGGALNTAYGAGSSVTSGRSNAAYDPFASVTGGCANAAGTQGSFDPVGGCPASGAQSVSGGDHNISLADFSETTGTTLATVISNGCGTAYFGSDSTGTSSATSDRCDVAFGGHDLTHCTSSIEPRPTLGYLTTTSSMASTSPGELIGITYGSQPNDTVVVTGRHSDGSSIPASQMGEFKLLVHC